MPTRDLAAPVAHRSYAIAGHLTSFVLLDIAPMLVRIIAWTLAAVFPTTGSLPGLDRLDSKPALARLLAQAPHGLKLGVYGATALFLVTPLLTVGWPVPALLLPRATLDRHADAMSGHPIYLMRQAMLLLKTIGGLIWGAHPAVLAALDMDTLPPDPGTWRRGEGSDGAAS